MTTKPKTTRVQVEMPETSMRRLKQLQNRTEAVSYAQVFRHALQLYEAIIEEQDRGSTMFIKRDDGSEVEVKIMGL